MKQQLTESSEGVQNTTPEIMLLWHIDYFELTSLENNQYKKSILTSPLPSENRKCNSHLKDALAVPEEGQPSYHQRRGVEIKRNVYK